MATRLGRTVATAKVKRGLDTERAKLGTFRALAQNVPGMDGGD